MPMLPLYLLFVLAILALPQRLSGEETLPVLAPDQLSAWPAIGRVNRADFSSTGFCTGTLVAPDIVLTAAHCIPAGPAPQGERRIFVAGWLRDTNKGHRQIVRGLRHPAYALGGRHSPNFDIGLAYLDAPFADIPPLRTGPFPTDAKALALIGYHQRRPFALSGRTDCPLLSTRTNIAVIGCPVISGNSGSPILHQSPDGSWHIVAVTSSTAPPNAIIARLSDWLTAHLPPSP